MKIRIFTALLILLQIALIEGCAPSYQSIYRDNDQRKIDQARKFSAAGDYKAAARIYRDLARKSRPPASDRYSYLAAESLYQAGDVESARKVADSSNPASLPLTDQYRLRLLYGRIFLADNKPEETFRQLEPLSTARMSPDLQLDYHSQRAEVFSRIGNHLESARERILAENLMQDPESIKKNQIAIIEELSELSNDSLTQLRPHRQDPLSGWMDLTWIFKQTAPSSATFDQRIREWKATYPRHPANIPFLISNVQIELETFNMPEAIGVVLPLSGPYAQVGEAIRQGILIARKFSSSPPIQTRFYNSDLADPIALYRQVIADGANVIVGPLQKNALKSLVTRNQLTVPVLGLNQLPGLDLPNLYQFGLNPEDEVEQAANSAWYDGYHRALIFSPSNSHGRRLAKAFTRKWRDLGGTIERSVNYNPEDTEYDEAVRQLLGIRGVDVNGSAGARNSGNVLFLIALPPHARLIKPMLQYYNAGDLAVYGTSQLYSGHQNANADQDLSGIVFCDIPWLFQNQIENAPSLEAVQASWEHPAIQYVRLMALGFDAYNLLPHLRDLEAEPDQSYPGVTGNLSLRDGRRIYRQLVCSEFQNGVPVPRTGSPYSYHNAEQHDSLEAWSD